MADTDNTPQEQAAEAQTPQQSPTPQQQGRPCPKDCRKCTTAQQICCASMLSFQMFEVMNGVIRRLDTQSQIIDAQSQAIGEQTQKLEAQAERMESQAQRLAEIESRLKAIQSSEAELSSPQPFEPDLFQV